VGKNVTFINDKGCEVLGYNCEDIIGKNWFSNFIPENKRKEAEKYFQNVLKKNDRIPDYFSIPVLNRSGNKKLIDWSNTALKDRNGDVVGVIYTGNFDNTCSRVETNGVNRNIINPIKLKEREKSSFQGRLVLQNNKIIYTNEAMSTITGYSREELISFTSKDINFLIHPDDRKILLSRYRQRLDGRRFPEKYEYRGIRKDGKICWFEMTVDQIEVNGKPAVECLLIDISEKKIIEEGLRISENNFRMLFEKSPESIIILDKSGKIINCNQSTEKLLGIKKIEMIGNHFNSSIIIKNKSINGLRAKYISLLGDENQEPFEIEIIRNDGKMRWIKCLSSIVKSDKDNYVYQLMLSDITERKNFEIALRLSESKYRELTNFLPQTIFEIDLNGKITYSNQNGFDSTGYSPKHLEDGLYIRDIFIPEDRERLTLNIKQNTFGHEIANHEYTLLRNDGTTCPVMVYSSPFARECRIVGLRCIVIDITERKKMEDQLKHSLDDKEILFRELKHRIKNNLQLLSSIVSMQIMRSNNPELSKKLQQIESVIDTMALIYSRAFEEIGLVGLNLNDFLDELVSGLMNLISNENIQIDFEITGDEVILHTDHAIPLVLIANEIIFNSLKHAFVGRKNGKISISFKNINNKITMRIRDNGIGIAPEIDIENGNSLGFRIIKNLTEQLHGTMRLNLCNGTEYIFEFSKEEVQ